MFKREDHTRRDISIVESALGPSKSLSLSCDQFLTQYPFDDVDCGAGILAIARYPELRSVVICFQVAKAHKVQKKDNDTTASIVRVTFVDVPDASISYYGDPIVNNAIVTLPPNNEDVREHSIDDFWLEGRWLDAPGRLKGGGHEHLLHVEADGLIVMFPFRDLIFIEVEWSSVEGTILPFQT